jgi:hypothetical protein
MGPAWITGRKVPPRPLVGVVLFSFEDVHVVTKEDERVRAGTRAEDVAMVVDVAGWGQGCDVTAVHGALIGKAQVRPAALMANGIPPLMGLNAADRSDCDPAMVGVGVGHHPLGPVEQHQTGTSFGLDQPPAPGRLRGHLRDQRTEILLVGSKLHQEPPHLVHIDDVSVPQLVKPSQKMAERAREIVTVHRPAPHSRSTPTASGLGR